MKRIGLLIAAPLLLLGISCSTSTEETAGYSEAEMDSLSAAANAWFDARFDSSVNRSPMSQSYLGIKKDYGSWDDLTDEAAQEELGISKMELQYLLDSIDPEGLDKQTRISYELFKGQLEDDIEDYNWRYHNYPVNQMFGMHSQVPSFLINIHQVTDSSDAAAYISRLNGVSELFDQFIENLKTREEKGVMPPKFVYPYAIESSKNILTGAPFESGEAGTLLADFEKKVSALDIDDDTKASMIEDAKAALLTSVKPAYEKLIAFLEDQETRATTDDGAWKLPDGESFYGVQLVRTTTTDLTADEIHQIGLDEVERIHSEMRNIMDQVGFDGDLQSFFGFLKTDDQFYFPDTDEGKQAYIDSATSIIDNMRTRLDELFITKPDAEITVKRVEAFREESAGKAFYNSPAPDGSRPGIYYANLSSTRNMPKYEMEALAYHEGIPGHHMDRTIAQELDNLPKFRRFGGYTAYVEGWGLYSEYLPKEMGMYANPYSDYGRLAMELWRACRLVVDTGIHSKKWTRQEGIDYYMNNTSGSDRECIRMVERHIVMPGQATAYKIGMLKIMELKSMAEEKLGDQFDIREFHEVVLTNGSVPLDVLEDLVNEWVLFKTSSEEGA